MKTCKRKGFLLVFSLFVSMVVTMPLAVQEVKADITKRKQGVDYTAALHFDKSTEETVNAEYYGTPKIKASARWKTTISNVKTSSKNLSARVVDEVFNKAIYLEAKKMEHIQFLSRQRIRSQARKRGE